VFKKIDQGSVLKSVAGKSGRIGMQSVPVVSTVEWYRDPGNNIRGTQSQTVGSRAAMGGKSGTVAEMKAAVTKRK
jgi:hypothetical protein